jgi:hypothetical protein
MFKSYEIPNREVQLSTRGIGGDISKRLNMENAEKQNGRVRFRTRPL